MAPALQSRSAKLQARPAINAFRVTKSSKLNSQPQASKQKLDAIEDILVAKVLIQPSTQDYLETSKKRRRDASDSDVENEERATRPQKSARKAHPTSITSPSASSPQPQVLPETLEELQTLHKSFTQALAVHYAHNGTPHAVFLSELLSTMTRLWKRRDVRQQDIERMLAVWELDASSDKEVDHKRGPFKLITIGIGVSQQTKLEKAWNANTITGRENELHKQYEEAIERLIKRAQRDSTISSVVYNSITSFPRLKCTRGAQSQARQTKITSIRDTILSKPSSQASRRPQKEPDFSSLTISDPADTPSRETGLKSRTLSLFDRLRAKQLANSTTSLSSTELLRRRALQRIPDLIPLLRMKQSQKLNSLFRSDLHGVPSATRTAKVKVSFSLEQLVQEVRDSSRVPIAAEEVREGICILGRECPGAWCSVYLGDGLQCVTLQGEGRPTEEVRGWCEREIQAVGK